VTKTEVLPVPPELVPKVWKSVRRVCFRKIPNYDIERTHTRLLVGLDQLWVAYGPGRNLSGVIVTSISKRAPQQRKAFLRPNEPDLAKSLTIHIAGEYFLLNWLDSAVERISHYAREQGCRMLFLMARKGWQGHMKRFYSPEWEAVALGRDRPTVSTCKRNRERNKPGYFRLLVPVPAEKWTRFNYSFVSTCRFKEVA